MKEYQFKVPNGVWLDVHADSEEEAVETINSSLHLLDEPLPAPGRIQRVQVDVREPVSKANIVSVYDLDTGESHTPNSVICVNNGANPNPASCAKGENMSDTPRTDEVSDRTTRKVAVWVLARDLEEEKLYTQLQIAQKRGEILEGKTQDTQIAALKEEVIKANRRVEWKKKWLKDAEEVKHE